MPVGIQETERFGRYRLIRRLAKGGMADVWLARDDADPTRDVVIKRIHPHLATDREFVLMFIDEAKIAARLDHPGCVQIFDLGRVGDAYYLAMEYIHGEDIRALARQARKHSVPLPRKLAVEIIAGACEGLDYAHDLKNSAGRPLKVVHRDVSPQNILVTYDGRVKIVDFGIAKAADQAQRTRAGVLKGKYAYMSPEQIMGLPLDRRSDVFALGVLLYELTTGRRLFKAETELETMRRITHGKVVPPTEASPGYPADLETIVLKALARDRDARYESADALCQALRGFLAEHRSVVPPEELAAFMQDLFADRLEAEAEAAASGDTGAFLDARFGDEGRAPGESGLSSASSARSPAPVAEPDRGAPFAMAPPGDGDVPADAPITDAPVAAEAGSGPPVLPVVGPSSPDPAVPLGPVGSLAIPGLEADAGLLPHRLRRWVPWVAVTVLVVGLCVLALVIH